MSILPYTMSFVSLPLSFIFISVYMPKSTLSMSFIIFPKSLIFSSIRPLLLTIAMPHIPFPLTLIPSTIFKDKDTSFLSFFKVIRFTLIRLSPIFLFICLIKLIDCIDSPKIARSHTYSLVLNTTSSLLTRNSTHHYILIIGI